MAEAFPVGSESTFLEISELCGLNEPDVRRILRLAMAHRIFREPRKGIVAHTQISKMLAETQQVRSWVGGFCWRDVALRCAGNTNHSSNMDPYWLDQTVPAMARWPNSDEPTPTVRTFQCSHFGRYLSWDRGFLLPTTQKIPSMLNSKRTPNAQLASAKGCQLRWPMQVTSCTILSIIVCGLPWKVG